MNKNFINRLPIFVLSLTILMGCSNYNEYIIDSDYSYKGFFKNYRTFAFVEMYSDDPVDSTLENMIKDEIFYRMNVRGYNYKEKNPNILVFYKLYEEDFKYTGYNQPELEYFVKYQPDEEEEIDEDDNRYDPVKIPLVKGTMLIQLMDRKKGATIWQGYASGLYAGTYTDNQKIVKNAVRSIFDRYRLFVEEQQRASGTY
ncbi:DUF4136 domain-containing protein [Marinigracilibium pacificum]|uniref:DUF4136 domain-containing protein n=1 Tax=Marinigracilibium pacificum TaxID=2729599 RepID=A0A848IXP7_9BACT|nr:DUF4136 domain-containing protein [Marinigracilibium pacificum]NMM49293.1 DUF4136 domain-containing protein [Marinigracilibium pacificum]